MSINSECRICHNNESIIPLSRINCPKRHTFHRPCLIDWLKRSSPYQSFNQKWNKKIQNIWDDTRTLGRSLPFADSFPVRQITNRILRPLRYYSQLPSAFYQTAKDSINKTAECVLCRNSFSQIDDEPLPQFKPINREDFLKNVRNRKLPALQIALDDQVISDAILEEAISLAIDLNRPAVISLFSQNSLIKDNIQARALMKASQKGHTKIVQTLLANGPISEEHRGIAVQIAAYRGGGHTEIVQTLLASGSISEKDRGRAVIGAVINRHKDLIPILLANGSILEIDRVTAVKIAVENSDTEIVQTLLDNDSILEIHRGVVVKIAVENGDTEIVQILLANGSISEEDREIAVKIAVENGDTEIVQALLNNGPISNEDRGSRWLMALQNGNKEIAQILLNSGPIPITNRLAGLYFNVKHMAWNQRYHLAAVGAVWIANRYFSTMTNPEGNDNL